MASHNLLIKHKNLLEGFVDGTILEIGSERGQGSTPKLAQFALKMNMEFISIDVDPEISQATKDKLEELKLPGKAVCEYGEKYLAKRKENVHAVYLDAFDFWHDHHPQKRIDAYHSRGTKITDMNCWKMHLACCVELVRLMPKGGVICFDDILNQKNWAGKGKLVIPYILENGFELVEYVSVSNSAIFVKKI